MFTECVLVRNLVKGKSAAEKRTLETVLAKALRGCEAKLLQYYGKNHFLFGFKLYSVFATS